ncbi:hypothetical protein O6H91_23G056300 [Diphasiastrum complanatum]|nr:hypothetical protein O6H91_23G056300 [Diphasiastrum complanatum]
MLAVLLEVGRMGSDGIWQLGVHLQFKLVSLMTCSALLVFGLTTYIMTRPKPVYLVDYACYKPPDDLKVPFSVFLGHSRLSGKFDEKSLAFQKKILERSGLGEETYFPRALHELPANISMSAARDEAEEVMFGALDELFEKTGVKPMDVGILVVNCSLFNPTPSLAAMIVNKYRMRGDIKSYNLGGMGCSAEVISIDLAKDILQLQRNTYAVVVCTENVTQNWYFGNDRSMLIPNCLFRMGGAAILLSNKGADRRRGKYVLVHTVRTHKGADTDFYQCAYQKEDARGKLGVSLSKDLMTIAAHALKSNITTLGPLVLPWSELLFFFGVLVARKLFNVKMKPYVPDFNLAFGHFCIHAGGRGVIDELEKKLRLSSEHVEASRMSLHRFGNTSSSTIWYELSYIESKGRMKKGDKIWQIAFGSGFKCNSIVWKSMRTIIPPVRGPWTDCIHMYPVKIPEVFHIPSSDSNLSVN